MDPTDEIVKRNVAMESDGGTEDVRRYEVSFVKIVNIFPNIKQIHFLNWYQFDDTALQKLIAQIKRPNNKLIQIKFLYHDYIDPLSNHPFFKDPSELSKELVDEFQALGWSVHKPKEQKRKTGYALKLSRRS